jgi:hypothetical protein
LSSLKRVTHQHAEAAHLSQHVPEQGPAAARVIAARRTSKDTRASQSDLPAADTLLIIQTTQRVGANSWVASVYVWRVVWVNPPQDAAQSEAVANKT